MNALQRRYTLDEILEIKKGTIKVQPLNYDALRMLRDPLYIKMGQELKEQASNQQAARHDDTEMRLLLERIANQRNVPLDQLEELLRNLLPKKKPAEDVRVTETVRTKDKDKKDDDDDDEGFGQSKQSAASSSVLVPEEAVKTLGTGEASEAPWKAKALQKSKAPQPKAPPPKKKGDYIDDDRSPHPPPPSTRIDPSNTLSK